MRSLHFEVLPVQSLPQQRRCLQTNLSIASLARNAFASAPALARSTNTQASWRARRDPARTERGRGTLNPASTLTARRRHRLAGLGVGVLWLARLLLLRRHPGRARTCNSNPTIALASGRKRRERCGYLSDRAPSVRPTLDECAVERGIGLSISATPQRQPKPLHITPGQNPAQLAAHTS